MVNTQSLSHSVTIIYDDPGLIVENYLALYYNKKTLAGKKNAILIKSKKTKAKKTIIIRRISCIRLKKQISA